MRNVKGRGRGRRLGPAHVRQRNHLAATHQETKLVALFHGRNSQSKAATEFLLGWQPQMAARLAGLTGGGARQGPFLGRLIRHPGSVAATSNRESSFRRDMRRGVNVSGTIGADIVRRPSGAVLFTVSPSSQELLMHWLWLRFSYSKPLTSTLLNIPLVFTSALIHALPVAVYHCHGDIVGR